MKFVGGYDIPLEGKPSDEMINHPEPDVLAFLFFHAVSTTPLCGSKTAIP